jgi:zinc transporter 5/7
MASTIVFSQPSTLRSQGKSGLAIGCLTTASFSFLFSPSLLPGTIVNGGLSALSFLGVLYDTNGTLTQLHIHDDHDHAHNVHAHHRKEGRYSAFTKFVISFFEPDSLIYSILSEKDSRRIAYFTL